MADLERFVDAQRAFYAQALSELQNGTKLSHWMWFIFPQIDGLGTSQTARLYAISGITEARAYLAHEILGPRLATCTEAMLTWAGKRSATSILGEVDAMKFCSCMTLFEAAGGGECFAHALDAFCQGRRDDRTLELLNLR
ncbi:DUF1810 domain-containing protein [Novosphingobium sp. KN65.2]|uniref:DUF1810 domain-containing protein n=1 Tax=Novosphingobium sp. KN65.2 TaxID=1478134 RepID=UPI0005EA4081|nr:DUF1810 domain-containing protein [Novosphingobium sp. KN65.2]CDO35753.1 conserved hypothetical protein [Novosphingobium sp. KN65.2]